MQIELFEGEHLPLAQARSALARGDLRAARAALQDVRLGPEAALASDRLAALDARLAHLGEQPRPAPEHLHRAFESALAAVPRTERDALGRSEWFRLYAARMASALAAAPHHRFRGWCGIDFAIVAGPPPAAFQAIRRLPVPAADGGAWLEAARAAHAAGEGSIGRRCTLVACLVSREPLDPAPPRLEPAAAPELDAPDVALPALPDAVEDLWTEVDELELPGAASAWVPCLGMLRRVFALTDLRSPDLRAASGIDPDPPASPEDSAPRSFLRALVAAWAARSREAGLREHCSESELAARLAMNRACPTLFERYLEGLGLGLR